MKLKILMISSRNPYHSLNLVYDSMTALERAGHEVDFLTVRSFKNQRKNMMNVVDDNLWDKFKKPIKEKYQIFRKKYHYILNPVIKIIRLFIKPKTKKYRINNNGISITCINEEKPPIDPKYILNKISKDYDLIITFFWQDMITAKTLKVIYDEYKIPIIIQPVDMFPLTGGCFYPSTCKNYRSLCGCCPALNSNNEHDQTRTNYLYKKKVYESIKCALLSNSYMLNFAEQCHLFDNSLRMFMTIILDENIFIENDINKCRNELSIQESKRFVILSLASKLDSRKGIKYMIESINKFCSNKTITQKNQMLLLLVGHDVDNIAKYVPIDVMNLGHVDQKELIKAYSVSSVFLSSTIDDAGPSMVNQSIMCSTPCVCFKIGTALDVIKQKENGYVANYKDTDDFAYGIEYIYSLNKEEYKAMRKRTREIALSFHSQKVYQKLIYDVYNRIKN